MMEKEEPQRMKMLIRTQIGYGLPKFEFGWNNTFQLTETLISISFSVAQ